MLRTTCTHAVSPDSLLTSEQVQVTVELAKHAKEACQAVSTEHKDIHASISKFGRAIDKVSHTRGYSNYVHVCLAMYQIKAPFLHQLGYM